MSEAEDELAQQCWYQPNASRQLAENFLANMVRIVAGLVSAHSCSLQSQHTPHEKTAKQKILFFFFFFFCRP